MGEGHCEYLSLSAQGKPTGMLIISRIPLSGNVAEQLAGFISFVIKHHNQDNQPVTLDGPLTPSPPSPPAPGLNPPP
jgi:hypothetical protein